MVDDVVKKHEEINASYSMGPAPKKAKTTEDALKYAIIDAKTMDYMELIQDHRDFVLNSENPPIEPLDFAGVLMPVEELSTKFIDYWKAFKDSRLSNMVLTTSSAAPASGLSEQVFSRADFQEQPNQHPQTLEERVKLQYAALNGKVFDFSSST